MDTVTARKRLEEMCEELEKSISVLQGEQTATGETPGAPQDQAGAGTSLSETDRTQAALDGLQVQRRQVLDALSRVEHGTYGTCADCGSPIPPGRLEARPEADRCVACQSKRDRVRH